MRIAKEIAGRQCPKCGSAAEQIMFGKNLKGIQRYRCKKCDRYRLSINRVMKINIYTNTATSLFLCSIFYKQLKFGHSQQKFGLDRAVFLCYNTTVKRPNRADKF